METNQPKPSLTEAWRQYNILIVDDEPHIIAQIQRDLYFERLNIMTATSAEEGMTILESVPCHVVISDQKMPGGMSGTEFLALVKKHYPHIVTMVLSAYSESDYILGALNEARAYYYLLKPWDKDDLIYRVKQALQLYHEGFTQREQVAHLEHLLKQEELGEHEDTKED